MFGAEDGLKLGSDVTLIALFLSLVLFIVSSLSAVYNRLSFQNLESVNKYVDEFAGYDHKTISGDSVQQFIQKYSKTMFIRVATDKSPTGIIKNDLKNVTNIDSAAYVNPVLNYYCVMLQDANGDVIGANFEQIGLTLTEQEVQEAIQQCKNELGE